MNLGEKLRALREREGYSQKELAELAEVPQSTIHRIESVYKTLDDATPKQTERLKGICSLFGITLEELVSPEMEVSKSVTQNDEIDQEDDGVKAGDIIIEGVSEMPHKRAADVYAKVNRSIRSSLESTEQICNIHRVNTNSANELLGKLLVLQELIGANPEISKAIYRLKQITKF